MGGRLKFYRPGTLTGEVERLAIAPYTARALGRTGALPVVRIGRSVRVRPATLRAFMERQETGRQVALTVECEAGPEPRR